MFPQLKITELEECSMDWSHQLANIEKDEEYMQHKSAASFIKYITA
jgi:hypothetical protein